MATPAAPWVTVGRIVGAWGADGWLKVAPATDRPDRLAPAATVYIDSYPYRIVDAHPRGPLVLLCLEGVTSRDLAASWRGRELTIPRDWLAPLPAGSYYHYQIIGLRVVTTAGDSLGVVEEILETGSNDVYIVRGGGREFLIPATDEAIRQVDLPGGRLVIEPIPGLLE